MLELNSSAKKSNKTKVIIMAAAFFGMLGLLGWLAWDRGFLDFILPEAAPPVPLEAKANKAVSSASGPYAVSASPLVISTGQTVKPAASAPVVAPKDDSSANYLHSAGKTKRITELLSELEVKKLEFAISELEQKTQDLSAPALPDASVFTPTAAMVAAPGPASAQPKIISIEGLDGKLQAVLRTSSGRKVVKPGDRIELGRIERITDSAVLFRPDHGPDDGKATINLSFEE